MSSSVPNKQNIFAVTPDAKNALHPENECGETSEYEGPHVRPVTENST